MQIVIDIPEEKYQGIINMAEEILDASTFCSPRYLYKAVLNGTPLPKNHGRLIEADSMALLSNLFCYTRYTGIDEKPYEDATEALAFAPTIIEADGGNAE